MVNNLVTLEQGKRNQTMQIVYIYTHECVCVCVCVCVIFNHNKQRLASFVGIVLWESTYSAFSIVESTENLKLFQNAQLLFVYVH
jgi:hypothetical protein